MAKVLEVSGPSGFPPKNIYRVRDLAEGETVTPPLSSVPVATENFNWVPADDDKAAAALDAAANYGKGNSES